AGNVVRQSKDPERRRGPWPGGSRGSSDDLAGAGTRLELRATAGRDRATSYDKVTRPGLRRARASGSIAGGGRRAETAKSTQVADAAARAPQTVPDSRSGSLGRRELGGRTSDLRWALRKHDNAAADDAQNMDGKEDTAVCVGRDDQAVRGC
ncbi:hypothetical protein THAOC_35162, partial [Thalassiosira oceanica]